MKSQQEDVQRIAAEKGWFDGKDTLPELVAHAHTELSEIIEALRQGGNRDPRLMTPEQQHEVGLEIADVLISSLLMFNWVGRDAKDYVRIKCDMLREREPRSYFNKNGRKLDGQA